MSYNYINNIACFKYFVCMAWRVSLTGQEKLLVTAMMLPVDGIKYVSEFLLRTLIKRWKKHSLRSLVDTIESDARFRTFLQTRMVSVAVHKMTKRLGC